MPKISISNKEYEIQTAVAELIDALQRENASLTEKVERLRQWLQVILDCADYTSGACRFDEMVGAVLPAEIIKQAKKTLLKK